MEADIKLWRLNQQLQEAQAGGVGASRFSFNGVFGRKAARASAGDLEAAAAGGDGRLRGASTGSAPAGGQGIWAYWSGNGKSESSPDLQALALPPCVVCTSPVAAA